MHAMMRLPSWNLVEALSADASHWQPADDVVDAADVVLRRAHAEGQPPSSPKMPPVDDFFPPRNAPRRQRPISGGLLSPSRSSEVKPSGLGLTSTPGAHQPAPDELESAAHWYHWYQRGEGSGAVGPANEEFNSPLRALNVNFTGPNRGGTRDTSNSGDQVSADWFPPAPILARTLAHNPSPPDEQQKVSVVPVFYFPSFPYMPLRPSSTFVVASCRRHPGPGLPRLLLMNARVRQKMQGCKNNCRMQGVLYLLEHSSCHGIYNQPQAEVATTFLLGGRVSEKYVMRDWCPTGLHPNLASIPLLVRERKKINHQSIGSAVQRPCTHQADETRNSKKTH
jgi:hypothetical protein